MSSIRFLRTFVAAAQGGSFAAAAEQVALTQAAVGQQIRVLEGELKAALFDKSGRNMTLTLSGHMLLPKAIQLLEQYDAIRQELQDEQPIAGKLLLGSLVSGMGPLSISLARLKSLYPALEIELRVQDQPRMMEAVTTGKLDAALVIELPWQAASGLRWTECYVEHLVVVAHPSVHPGGALTPSTLQDLFREQPFIRFDRRTPTGGQIDRIMQSMNLVPRELLEINSILSIAELVRKNIGFTMIPLLRFFDWEKDPNLRVLHLTGMPVARRLGILESGKKSHITEVVRTELIKQMKSLDG